MKSISSDLQSRIMGAFGVPLGPLDADDEPTINFLGDLQRLELKPGDQFVLTVPRVLTVDQHNNIQQVWQRFVGDEKSKLLVIDSGMKLGAIHIPKDEE